MRAERRGTALIEVLVAFVVVATAGTGFITLMGQMSHTIRTVRNTERLTRNASLALARLTLLDRDALRSREGVSSFHGSTLRITALSAGLFDVDVLASPNATAPILSTTLYRPDSSDVSP